MSIDKEKFAAHLRKHAVKLSQRKCAAYIRKALEAGGARTTAYPIDAKDYGPVLLRNGYRELHWVSDFVQSGFWPGPAYRKEKPSYVIYRP